MYYESGAFSGGTLVIDRPIPYLTVNFRAHHQRGELLPLAQLVTLPRARFYGSCMPTLLYSQSGSSGSILQNSTRRWVLDLIARLNSGSLTANDQVLAFLSQATGMSLAALNAAYVGYALTR
jgi:hypothetical protein